jgi:hypothetical protein
MRHPRARLTTFPARMPSTTNKAGESGGARRSHRRVSVPGKGSAEPKAVREPDPEALSDGADDNDDRLRRDKPPHWG